MNIDTLNVSDQVDSDIDATFETGALLTDASNPTWVLRPGSLSSGRTYTFSLTATDPSGSIGYTGKFAETIRVVHAAPPPLHARTSDLRESGDFEEKFAVEF